MRPPDVPPGTRVTVLFRTADGHGEAVGRVVAADGTTLMLATRHGDVAVPVADLRAWREVRPRPWRIENFMLRGRLAVFASDVAELPEVVGLLDRLGAAGIPARIVDVAGDLPGPPPDVPPGTVHFTSADARAVDAARALGWQARQFTRPDSLRW